MASRLLYGMSREGVVPAPFGSVHPARRTPWVAIAFTTALAAVLVLTGDLAPLADTTVARLVVVFAIVNVTVLILRRDPVEHRHFRVPWPAPLLGIGVSVAVLNALVIRRQRARSGNPAQPAADAAASAARSSRSSPQ
jgi:basic amino acid/polyamine antiporter, APA family